jgi:hypothetical protein
MTLAVEGCSRTLKAEKQVSRFQGSGVFRESGLGRLQVLNRGSLDRLELRRGLRLLGDGAEKTPVCSRLERHAQAAVIVVADSDEAKRLKTCALIFARGVQHFGHAVDGAGAGVKCDFDKVAGGELVLELEQTAVDRDGLKFCASPLTTFRHDSGSDRTVKLNARRTPGGIVLGEVGHNHLNMTLRAKSGQITKARVHDVHGHGGPGATVWLPDFAIITAVTFPRVHVRVLLCNRHR